MPSAKPPGRTALYASAGKRLLHFDLDAANAALAERGATDLPENVQYAWPHPGGRLLYVAWSNGVAADRHGVTAFRIDGATGALAPAGDPVPLPHRTIHCTVDRDGAFLLFAFNRPRTVMVRRLAADGTIGPEVVPPVPPDGGFFTHQVRVAPGNRLVLTCAIGGDPAPGVPEQLGQITAFGFADGVLTPRQAFQPGPGLGPRHLDFHPTLPLAYVLHERGNQLAVHRLTPDAIEPAPTFTAGTLADPASTLPQQRAGAIHVHPGGGFVTVTNRCPAGPDGVGGGQNSLAVFALDPQSGAPRLVQHEDTRGAEPRTFAIEPSGRALVVANQRPTLRAGAPPSPPNLALFRIDPAGRLGFVATTPITHGGDAFWVGTVGLPG